jgi:hypothetical protein
MKTYWRNIMAAIHDRYFWIWALPCLTLTVVGLLAMYWMFGFDRNYRLNHFYGTCRNLNDKESLIMLLSLFIATGGNLLALGEILLFADKKRRHIKIDYLGPIVIICVAILSTATVMILARKWCL